MKCHTPRSIDTRAHTETQRHTQRQTQTRTPAGGSQDPLYRPVWGSSSTFPGWGCLWAPSLLHKERHRPPRSDLCAPSRGSRWGHRKRVRCQAWAGGEDPDSALKYYFADPRAVAATVSRMSALSCHQTGHSPGWACFRDPEPSCESNGVLSGLALLLTNQKTL